MLQFLQCWQHSIHKASFPYIYVSSFSFPQKIWGHQGLVHCLWLDTKNMTCSGTVREAESSGPGLQAQCFQFSYASCLILIEKQNNKRNNKQHTDMFLNISDLSSWGVEKRGWQFGSTWPKDAVFYLGATASQKQFPTSQRGLPSPRYCSHWNPFNIPVRTQQALTAVNTGEKSPPQTKF